MLTKYRLHIGTKVYELSCGDIVNWDDVRCSYKRPDYDGVVRSLSSKFEFSGEARELLMEAYLKDRFNASAFLSVLTANNRWVYKEAFRCPLDFSTISWDSHTLAINCVDNSLAALIKANRSTKYEFVIGEDIFRDGIFAYDRIPMLENVTYGFTQGTSFTDSGDITVTFEKDRLPFVGKINSEVSVNGSVFWNDDQDPGNDDYLLKAERNVDVVMDYDIEWRTNGGDDTQTVDLSLRVRRNGQVLNPGSADEGKGGHFVSVGKKALHYLGTFLHPGALPDTESIPEGQRGSSYALIGNIVWILQYNGRGHVWKNTVKTFDEYYSDRRNGKVTLHLTAGDEVFLSHSSNPQTSSVRFISSKFTFSWQGVGEMENIDVFRPESVATALLRRIAGGVTNVNVSMSDHDPRLAGTYVMAAESARGLSEAKLYSSFAEFCDWMSAVFGYVYLICKPETSKYNEVRECGGYEWAPLEYNETMFNGDVLTDNIIYCAGHGKFLYRDQHSGSLHSGWTGDSGYNGANGHARTDTLFRIKELSQTSLYYFGDYAECPLLPEVYGGSADSISSETQNVRFVHRSEILDPCAEVRRMRNTHDVRYSVESSMIYSSVTVGYDKKDYDSVNGRDEFNFSNTYTTGCTVTDNVLSLISKYRADSYGIEFAVQKRGKGTTDSQEDKDVFFVLCADSNGVLRADRTSLIENSLTGAVFNGAFSPMACARANAGYIGLQSDSMTLTFASSTGNASIVIDGEPMTADIAIDTPLATNGIVEFSTDFDGPTVTNGIVEFMTDDVNFIADADEIVEIADMNGMVYRGFLQDVDIKYARSEAAKYKLIVKEIEP